jgi:hypothetical protein
VSCHAQRTIENSSYNGLETNLRYVGKRSDFLLGYTYSKSIDLGSNLGEQLDPLNHGATRAISAWDMRHNFEGGSRWICRLINFRGARIRHYQPLAQIGVKLGIKTKQFSRFFRTQPILRPYAVNNLHVLQFHGMEKPEREKSLMPLFYAAAEINSASA